MIDDRDNPQYRRSPKKLIPVEDKAYIEQKIRAITGMQLMGMEGWGRLRPTES
jgi:hypothetical protein